MCPPRHMRSFVNNTGKIAAQTPFAENLIQKCGRTERGEQHLGR